jgi:hypothetical protein
MFPANAVSGRSLSTATNARIGEVLSLFVSIWRGPVAPQHCRRLRKHLNLCVKYQPCMFLVYHPAGSGNKEAPTTERQQRSDNHVNQP